jgi:hypothetical protein
MNQIYESGAVLRRLLVRRLATQHSFHGLACRFAAAAELSADDHKEIANVLPQGILKPSNTASAAASASITTIPTANPLVSGASAPSVQSRGTLNLRF